MKRVLIADDEEDMRTLLRAMLSDSAAGIQTVDEAADGVEALAVWREVSPDVVVLDHRMPGLTGMEVAEQILAEAPDQGIILFSAYLDDDMRTRALEMGIRTCLSKDDVFSLPEVVRTLAG